MKILLAHVVYRPGLDNWYADIAKTAPSGIEVERFCVTLSPPGPRLLWRQLDRMWHCRSLRLINMYRRLRTAAQSCDVLLAYNGANIHPDFLRCLNTYNVFCCFDDPESSATLSEPVAKHFDAVFFGNIASRFQYQHWGCEKLAWLPIFNAPMDVPKQAEREAIFSTERTIDTALVCERTSLFRHQRLEKLAAAFPNTRFHGASWPKGRISQEGLIELYRNLKIGWNIHNSTGPINRRLFQLPAFGVMQICDNKSGLGKIYRLGEEAVGFDTIPEAIELTHYYLEHNQQREAIAIKGYERFWKDYHAGAIWKRIVSQLNDWDAKRKEDWPQHLPVRPRSDIKSILQLVKEKAEKTLCAYQRYRSGSKGAKHVRPTPLAETYYAGCSVEVYHENPKALGKNKAAEQIKEDGFLDWPNIYALNWAVTSLIGSAKKIVAIGSETRSFTEYASVDPDRKIHYHECDDFARRKAVELRSRNNVHFCSELVPQQDGFDLLVCVEVLEYVQDLTAFIEMCRRLAPRAIITYSNRRLSGIGIDEGPPAYGPRMREFDPGEVYMLLRSQYRRVSLYCMPDIYVPWIVPMTIRDKETPIIAYCEEPFDSV